MTDHSVALSEELSGTSSTLLRQAAARDETSWRTLVDRYGRLVYRHCRKQGLQPASAADVVQDVFLAVARNLKRYRHDRPEDSFRGWLLTITWNKIRDHVRASKRSPAAEGGADGDLRWLATSDAFDASSSSQLQPLPARIQQARQVIDRVRAEFPQEKWTLFFAVVMDGCDPAEVALAAATTVNVVYLAKSRILRRLRVEMAKVLEEEA